MYTSRIPVLCLSVVFGLGLALACGEMAFGSGSANDSQQSKPVNMTPKAGPDRPAKVPDGYVITPFGYFHASCVQSLAKGERVLADGRVQHADGSVEESASMCSYPHYTRNGVRVSAGAAPTNKAEAGTTPTPPVINGWVEQESISTYPTTETYGGMTARWTVPGLPRADDGQVLFFFPGLEDIYNTQSILQPVLGLYSGEWVIASWNCCLNGIVTNSPAVNVSPGDRIYGSITSTCGAGTSACASWNVLSLDLTTGESTTLGGTPSDGQTFDWAFGGVLEIYSVISCDDLPPDGRTVFDQITVFDQNLKPVRNPKWGGQFDSTDTPQCGYGVEHEPHKVTLNY